MDLGLQGKVAIVAAASRGIGRAIAMGFAREGAGVAICARDRARLEKTAAEIRSSTGARVFAMPADLTVPEEIDRFVQAAVDEFGGIDILVTNAGGPKAGKPTEIDDAGWAEGVELTLMSVVRLSRAVVPHLLRRRGGRIVNVTASVVRQPIEDLALASSLRLAVIGFAKTLSMELAGQGITVNNIAQGWTDTDSAQNVLESRALQSGSTAEEERRNVLARLPMGRMARVEEIAGVALFLASGLAGIITGATIQVDGGNHRGTM